MLEYEAQQLHNIKQLLAHEKEVLAQLQALQTMVMSLGYAETMPTDCNALAHAIKKQKKITRQIQKNVTFRSKRTQHLQDAFTFFLVQQYHLDTQHQWRLNLDSQCLVGSATDLDMRQD